MELPFAAVQQLCAPILALGERLPRPQRDALDIAFGLSPGPAPNPFLVALAVLGLLSEAARERGLLCVIDDAQWLDRASAQVLGFAARRLAVERIAIVFAAREMGEALRGLPEVHVEPLGHRDARALLESVLPAPLDDQVLERLIVETRRQSPRAGGVAARPGVVADSPAASACRRQRRCTPGSRRASSGEWRPCRVTRGSWPSSPRATRPGTRRSCGGPPERLGIPESAAHRGGVERPDRVPAGAWPSGIRSFAPRSTGPPAADERTEVHRALAEATDPETDPDRRAWHRAQAAVMPDEDVAADLERSAARAQARGGFAAAAAFLERSAALTVEPARRAARALAAAQAKHQAGADRRFGRAARDSRGRPARRAFNGPRRRSFGRESHSPPTAAATRRRCCSRRRAGSSNWTCRWRARPTSTR